MVWDCPDHELIEQRHGKGHVAMRGTVDHPLFDQTGAQKCNLELTLQTQVYT